MGLRIGLVRAQLPTNPVVVIVSNTAAYADAIGKWDFNAGRRYPVLIDDGSWAARQAIARFVRAFKPQSVVRWESGFPPLPNPVADRRALLERIAGAPWKPEEPTLDSLKKKWASMKFTPPGIVLANADDPAWTAAIAIAAARGQPLFWTSLQGGLDDTISLADADAFERLAEGFAESTGFSWSALGDDLESITICLNGATRVQLAADDQRAMLAITDCIGRKATDDKSRRGRWAWAGMVTGNAWQAAYSAMSGLFLATDNAWLFDGYESGPPWNQWDCTEAATTLEKAGIKTLVDDNGRTSLNDWRRRAAGGYTATGPDDLPMGVDAALIAVNSMGNGDFFMVHPGEGKPPDAPILRRPAIVGLVHSWSAQAPGNVDTVAGRWLVRGAYAYVGSVHEPYLQAFVPTPKLMQRLSVGMPLGAAARLDNGEVWKINILGDPLITIGKLGPIVNMPIGLDGVRDMQDDLATALKERQFARALADLSMLGRDKDAARLAASLLAQQPEAVTPEVALLGLAAAFHAGDMPTFVGAYAKALPLLGTEDDVRANFLWDARDMAWHALWPRMNGMPSERADLLAGSLRAGTLVRDAQEAFGAVDRASGRAAGLDVLSRAAKLARNEAERQKIEAMGR